MSNMIRVVVADDHPLMRAGLRAQLAEEPEYLFTASALNFDMLSTAKKRY